jgi:hypothetical protein
MTEQNKTQVGILLPDGTIADSLRDIKCHKCGEKVPLSRLDELLTSPYDFGIVCWRCERDMLLDY